MPRNAEKAITPDFYRYTPNTNRSNYGSVYIPRPDRHRQNMLISDQESNVARLAKDIADLDSEIAKKKQEIDSKQVEHREKNKELQKARIYQVKPTVA